MSDKGTISILMGTYNGEKYLEKQLQSIADQTYTNWKLYISDDGSIDSTINIIKEFSKDFEHGKISLIEGPRKGFAENFLSLLKNETIKSDFYSFCDQDDIWHHDKISDALNMMNAHLHKSQYVLYGSRTKLIDTKGRVCGYSPIFKREFCLKNALVQSFAGGNTMLFNRDVKIILETLPSNLSIISHDWILYIIVTALNGKVIYDDIPKLFYRQHENNVVGSNRGVLPKIERIRKIYDGQYKIWNESNEEILSAIRSLIPNDNCKIIDSYFCKEKSSLLRLFCIMRSGVFRQSRIETLIFIIMSMLGKIH